MAINEQDILDNFEKELLYSFKNLTLHNNVKEISRSAFNHWIKNELKTIVLKCITNDINFDMLGEEILRIASEKEEKEILESYNQYDFSFNISKHFLCYFENNDYSNLDNDELQLLKDFTEFRTYQTFNTVYGEDFKTCEITNMQSDCIEMFFNEKI